VIFDEEWEHLRFAVRDLDAQDQDPVPRCTGVLA
jgi:hypothetical protein